MQQSQQYCAKQPVMFSQQESTSRSTVERPQPTHILAPEMEAALALALVEMVMA